MYEPQVWLNFLLHFGIEVTMTDKLSAFLEREIRALKRSREFTSEAKILSEIVTEGGIIGQACDKYLKSLGKVSFTTTADFSKESCQVWFAYLQSAATNATRDEEEKK